MKYRVMRKNKVTNEVFEVGSFPGYGDAVWTATLFASMKSFEESWLHWVEKGKSVSYPASAINPESFNLINEKEVGK